MGTATPAPKRHSFITNFARAGFALNPPVDASALVRRDQTTTTLYVAGAEVVLNRAANTTTATRHYQGLGRTVATRSGAANSSVSWVFADVNNTASWQVRSTDSAVTWRRWTPFGGSRAGTGSWVGKQGFVEGLVEAEAGLTRVGARDYEAHTGRFTSPDPILDPDSPLEWNPYAYGGWDPVSNPDPTGLKWCLEVCDAPHPKYSQGGLSKYDWIDGYDATFGPGQPSATNPGVANTHLDNPLRRLTRKHAGYTKSERETGGYSPRNKGRGGSGGMTRAGAEVAAFAITLALTGVGCTIGGALGCYLGGVAGSYLGAKYKCATIQCAPGEVGRDTAMAAIPLPGGAGKGAKLLTTTKKGTARGADNLLPGLLDTAPKPLGRGSTGRTVPRTIKEQMAMTSVRNAPRGKPIPMGALTDQRWLAREGWVKMQQVEGGVTIHYVWNKRTGAVDDFKFKAP